ncbi:MAG: outer membrane beta-barrel protein [Marinilabilia sp.]
MTRTQTQRALWLAAIWLILSPGIFARNDSTQQTQNKKRARVEECRGNMSISFPGGRIQIDETNDTITQIIIGRRQYEIIDKSGHHNKIQVVRKPLSDFNGHWSGFDLGFTNFFAKPFDSQLPEENAWMDLNGGKSVAVGMNLFQQSIGLRKNQRNLGLVTGVGWTINNYRFDSPNILRRSDDGQTTYELAERKVDKNKLVTSFLTVPLLLEWQLPGGQKGKDFFLSGGFYGSFRLGSHTKVVFDDNGGKEKKKWREDLNTNAFKYGIMIRTGYKRIKLYAKSDLTSLFEAGRGPEVYPWTVGVTLLQF